MRKNINLHLDFVLLFDEVGVFCYQIKINSKKSVKQNNFLKVFQFDKRHNHQNRKSA
jgi:hypothetical protein